MVNEGIKMNSKNNVVTDHLYMNRHKKFISKDKSIDKLSQRPLH